MLPAEGLLTALERNWAMVDTALEGLDEEILSRQPNAQCNSIAWTLWHMDRVLDTFVHTRLQDKPQSWIKDGWFEKHGMTDNPEERGVGWTIDQVTSWSPPSSTIQLGYYASVKQAAREYISSLTQDQLEVSRVIPPVSEPRTVAAALGQVTWDNIAHGGQIAYLRGFFRGMGWYSI